MGTVKVTNIEPIADNGTVTLGGSGDTIALASGTKLTGHGQYVVEKIDDYTYSTNVSLSGGGSAYLDIAGGNTINFTPTSTNDVIYLTGGNNIRISGASMGAGLGFTQGTSSTLSSSDTIVKRTGRYSSAYTTGMPYIHSNLHAVITGLTADTTYYFDMFGQVYHASTGSVYFNYAGTETSDNARHYVIGKHYKYIG